MVAGGGVAAPTGPAAFRGQPGVELVQVETGQPADVLAPDDVGFDDLQLGGGLRASSWVPGPGPPGGGGTRRGARRGCDDRPGGCRRATSAISLAASTSTTSG